VLVTAAGWDGQTGS